MFATKRFGVRNPCTTKNLPDGYIQSSTGHSMSPSSYVHGGILVSAGIFIPAIGGSWDITSHLLNKPEIFVSTPHGMLYTGVASSILGCVFIFRGRKNM